MQHDAQERAYGLIQNGRLEEAGVLLDKVLEKTPGDSTALYNRGKVYYKKGEFEKAVPYFSQAILVDPDLYQAWDMRGLCLVPLGKYAEAIKDYTQAILLDGKSPIALYNRGWAYYKQGEYKLALEDLTEAVKLAPEAPNPRFARAYVYIRFDEPKLAVQDLEIGLKEHPHYANGLNLLAWIMAVSPEEQLRDGARAYEYALRACELDKWRTWQFIGTLAAAAAEKGEFELAIKYQEQALTLKMSDRERRRCEDRLELFKERRPYRCRINTKPPLSKKAFAERFAIKMSSSQDFMRAGIEDCKAIINRIDDLKKEKRWDEVIDIVGIQLRQLLQISLSEFKKMTESGLEAELIKKGPTSWVPYKKMMLISLLKECGDFAIAKREAKSAHHWRVAALNLLLESKAQGEVFDDRAGLVPTVNSLLDVLAGSELPLRTRLLLVPYFEAMGAFTRAEDALFAAIEHAPGNEELFKLGMAFYERLQSKSDAVLESGEFTREEVESSAMELRRKFSDRSEPPTNGNV